jgi:hypothetical protein
MSDKLNSKNALIWRIVHIGNIPSIFKDGCLCRNDAPDGAKYIDIGNLELIEKRRKRVVPCHPGGTLGDYVPFYFTPYSPMLYSIKTGHNGHPKKPMDEIVILCASLHNLVQRNVEFVFTDRHAMMEVAKFSGDLRDLSMIDWEQLQRRNFKRQENPEPFEKYQAEALVFKQMPFDALTGVVCFNDDAQTKVEQMAERRGLNLNVVKRPNWFFQ